MIGFQLDSSWNELDIHYPLSRIVFISCVEKVGKDCHDYLTYINCGKK